MKNSKPILVIEDDIVDVMTIRRAFKELKISNTLIHAKDGEDALEYLGQDENEKPCMMFLDLNMPRMNGIEFLKERAKNKELVTIPVIVLTTSKDSYDKKECFKLNIAGYMVKPVDYDHFVQIIKIVDDYWTISELVN